MFRFMGIEVWSVVFLIWLLSLASSDNIPVPISVSPTKQLYVSRPSSSDDARPSRTGAGQPVDSRTVMASMAIGPPLHSGSGTRLRTSGCWQRRSSQSRGSS